MLGLLRRDMTADALRPQPGIGTLEELVARAGEGGTTVHLTVEGSSDGLPRGVEVVVYRVVERTVEHACRAGVPQLSVHIRHSAEAVGVQVRGRGIGRLVGEDHLAMRERVVVFGGDLVMGTDEHDRDVLEVRLPLPAAAEATPA
jgi:signal transduction histidine kinase